MNLYDLDFDTDNLPIKKEGCPCPVEWCEAHVLRHAACGDAEGPYEGTHVGRVQRFKNGRWQGVVARRLAKIMGRPAAPETVWCIQSLEDGCNNGLIPGPPTPAQRRQAKARNLSPLE